MKRNVLLIGGAGYVGSSLSRALLKKGYGVVVLDNLIYKNGSSMYDLLINPDFKFVHGNFGDPSDLELALNDITDVILLAALVGDPICKKYPELAKLVNLEFPKNLFHKIHEKGIKNFVFTSTCSNYGLIEDDTKADEQTSLNPKSLYAETKVEFEEFILENNDQVDFNSTILRISTAFGISARMRFDLTISEFTKEMVLGRPLLVYDENTWRPYCHVQDISNAIVAVIEADPGKVDGEIFNVGGDSGNYTKKMIVEEILNFIPEGVVSYKEGGFDPRNYRVSFEKIRNQLNFSPKYSVSDSIERIMRAFRNNLFDDIDERNHFYGNYQVFENKMEDIPQ